MYPRFVYTRAPHGCHAPPGLRVQQYPTIQQLLAGGIPSLRFWSGREAIISFGMFLETENECFRAAKSIVNLMDPKLVIFPAKILTFSVIIFGTASNRKWGSFFDQHPRSKLASGFGFPRIMGGSKR